MGGEIRFSPSIVELAGRRGIGDFGKTKHLSIGALVAAHSIDELTDEQREEVFQLVLKHKQANEVHTPFPKI
jgi:hypothetical protein